MAELPQSVRQGLVGDPRKAGEHLDPNVLAAFSEGALRPAERERTMAHLAVCAVCRDVLALMAPEEGPPLPQFQPVRWWRRAPVLRWSAVAASVAVVLGAAVLYRQENRHETRWDSEIHSGAAVPKAPATPPNTTPAPETMKRDEAPSLSEMRASPERSADKKGAVAGVAEGAGSRPAAPPANEPYQSPSFAPRRANPQEARGPAGLLGQQIPPLDRAEKKGTREFSSGGRRCR